MFAASVASLALGPRSAGAQVFAMISPAATLPEHQRAVSAAALFDDQLWGALGQARAGLGSGFDAGFQFGVSSYDDTPTRDGATAVLLALDAKKQIRWAGPGRPADVSVDLGLGVESGDDLTRVVLLPQALASHRIVYDDRARAITPYGGIGLGIERVDIAGFSDTDAGLQARFGGLWEPSPGLGIHAELAFGGHNQFLVGATWPF